MKKLMTTIIGLLLFQLVAFSQTITLSDMISKVKCKDFSCINDFITRKGFSLSNLVKKSKNDKFYYYFLSDETFHSTSNVSITNQNYVGFTCTFSDTYIISFGTDVKSHYQSLKDSLSTLQFKSYNTEDEGDGQIAVSYSSLQYPNILVVARTMPSKGSSSATHYHFQVVWY